MPDIIPNVVVSMPSQLFTMPQKFGAVFGGRIYIGLIDTDPTIPSNQIQVYLENEDESLVPVAQPLLINAGGYPVYNGQIAKFVTVQGHAMAVYDALNVQQFYFPNVLKYDPDQYRQLLEGQIADGELTQRLYYKYPDVDSVSTFVQNKLDTVVSVKDFGAVGDGIANDTAAFVKAGVSGRTFIVPKGDYVISPSVTISGSMLLDGNLIVNSTCTIASDTTIRGGQITVNSGFTLTATGTFKAPIRKVFYGAGVVIGIKETYPEWWGASYTTNSADAIMSAYNCIIGTQSYTSGILHLNAYLIEKTVTFKLVTEASVKFLGGGTNLVGGRFQLTSPFSGSYAVRFMGDADPLKAIASFSIEGGWAIANAAGSGATIGMGFGATTGYISGITKNKIESVNIQGFNQPFDVMNTRLLSFRYCSSGRGGLTNISGIRFRTGGAMTDAFVGDCDIQSCQFEMEGSTPAMSILVSTAGHQAAGISVDKTAFYKSTLGTQLVLDASNGGYIGDIFIGNGVQFDGFSTKFVSVTVTGSTSTIADISFLGCYFRGATSGTSFIMQSVSSGKLNNIRVANCWFSDTPWPIYLVGVTNAIIANNNFNNITASANVIALDSCTGFSVSGNVLTRSGSDVITNFVNAGGAGDYFAIVNNVSAGVATNPTSVTATGTHKTVTGNI
ncbi:phage tailspike protein [Yersinia enterocolitica]|uniref:phage head-binding domain-containing protein n=1 Tax=Yersinia enterocolitica TaxID=630 RepID=UPI003D073055